MNTKGFFLFGIALLAAAYMMGSGEAAPDVPPPPPATEAAPPTSPLTNYLPSIPKSQVATRAEFVGKKLIARPLASVQQFTTGKAKGQIGIDNKDTEADVTGPGAFVMLKGGRIAVLDTANGRVTIYPKNGSGSGKSIPFPVEKLPDGSTARAKIKADGLGLSTDKNGDLMFLARDVVSDPSATNPNKRLYHAYYMYGLDAENPQADFRVRQSFTFGDPKTNDTAQALSMEAYGDKMLIHGVHKNEFHILGASDATTDVVKGYPIDGNANSFLRMKGDTQNIRIETIDRDEKVQQTVVVPGDIDRLRSYRILPTGHVALDLEADQINGHPREVALYELKDGQGRLVTTAPLNANVDSGIDQDLYFDNLKLFQLSKKHGANGDVIDVSETEFKEDI